MTNTFRTARCELAGQIHPNLAAFLDMIAWSEGTDDKRQPTQDRGYDVVVGGGNFSGYADHPRQLVYLPKLDIKSSAAGRYQLLARYWDAYRRTLNLKAFDPAAQDAVAIQQIRECKAIAQIERGEFEGAVRSCRRIWASLPGAGYGQHEQHILKLAAAYEAAGGQIVPEAA